MEEKKLTDEEWFAEYAKACKSLEDGYCEQLAYGGTSDAQTEKEIEGDRRLISYVHRLQDDYSKLKERYVKVLDLNEKVIAEQKAEIERLTKKAEEATFWENEYLEWATGFLKTRFDIKDWFTNPETQKTPCTYEFFASTLWEKIRPAMEWLDELKERNEALRKENYELQKQVDELRDICLDCPYKLKFDEIEKQVVKDTAKEIYLRVKNKSGAELSFLNDLALWIKERFGVAVEKWIKVDGVEVE